MSNEFLLKELLFQLADDDFIIAFRGSEWLGLTPHIEEDVAFSSINQNTMGHASMYYQHVSELGGGTPDALAHSRTEKDRRNAILVELANGPGHYLENPQYDWAFAVVRHYLYEMHKQVRLESLTTSSYQPLQTLSQKILSEQFYHVKHWETWFTQLMLSTEDARERMIQALDLVWPEYDGLMTLGKYGRDMEKECLIDSHETLRTETLRRLSDIFQKVHYTREDSPGAISGNGRNGEHTEQLSEALATLSEVYNTNPVAQW